MILFCIVVFLTFLAIQSYKIQLIRTGTPYTLDGVTHNFDSHDGKVQRFPIMRDDIARLLKSIYSRFIKVCDAHGVQCWASEGTLLGAVRHKGFVPWDDDIDLCVFLHDIPVLRSDAFNADIRAVNLDLFKFAPTGNPDVIKVLDRNTKSPNVDVFFAEQKGDRWGICTQTRSNFVSSQTSIFCDTLRYMHTLDDVLPLREVAFEDITMRIPNRALNIIRERYGPDATQAYRFTHSHFWFLPVEARLPILVPFSVSTGMVGVIRAALEFKYLDRCKPNNSWIRSVTGIGVPGAFWVKILYSTVLVAEFIQQLRCNLR